MPAGCSPSGAELRARRPNGIDHVERPPVVCDVLRIGERVQREPLGIADVPAQHQRGLVRQLDVMMEREVPRPVAEDSM